MNSLLTDPANHPANSPLTGERIERIIEALKRSLQYQNGGDMAYVIADAIKGLEELMKMRSFTESADRATSFEFEPVRFTPAYATPTDPVMYCSQETIAASKDGEHLLRTLSTPSGDCVIPLYYALPAPVVPETLPCPVLLEPGMRLGKGVKTQLLFDALKRRAEYYAELDAMTPEQRAEHDAGVAEFKAMLGGNSPATPDGWKLVPEEPTHEMLEAGDAQFGTYDVYRRMISAAPQEVK